MTKRFSIVLFVLVFGLIMTACGSGSGMTATETATATVTAEPTVAINATPGVPVITGTGIPGWTPALTEAGTGKPVGWVEPNLNDMVNSNEAWVEYIGSKFITSGEEAKVIDSFIASIDSQLAEQGNFRFLDYYNAVKMGISGVQKIKMVGVAGSSWILVPYDAAGRILWQNPADGSVAEYPYQLSVTATKISVVEADFEPLAPEIKDVVLAGPGLKPVPVGEAVNIGGEEYYRLVWNPFTQQVEANNQEDIVKALLGFDLSIDVAHLPVDSLKQVADGSWMASVDGKSYIFGLDGKWAEGSLAPSPEFLAKLNLNPDRTYEVIDNFYVDSYNNAKWAFLDNGVWRETTLEEKYGHIEIDENLPHIPFSEIRPGDTNNQDRGIKTALLSAYWTGDYTTEQIDNNDAKVTGIYGIFVTRDWSHDLLALKVWLYSPDVPGISEVQIDPMKVNPDGSIGGHYQSGDLLDLLPVGAQVSIGVYYELPAGILEPDFCNAQTGECTQQINLARQQYWSQGDKTREFIDRIRAGEKISNTLEIVLVPSLKMAVYPKIK